MDNEQQSRFDLLELDLPGVPLTPANPEPTPAPTPEPTPEPEERPSLPVARPLTNWLERPESERPAGFGRIRGPMDATPAPARATTPAPERQKMALIKEFEGDSGVGVGWAGSGTLLAGSMREISEALGLPAPKSKRLQHFAARAVDASRTIKDLVIKSKAHASEWALYDVRVVDEPKLISVLSFSSGEWAHTPTDHYWLSEILDRVRAEYARLTADEVISCQDVGEWVEACLTAMNAAQWSVLWYVPAAQRARATHFVELVAQKWGRSWTNPPFPAVTSDELGTNLLAGFTRRITALIASIDEEKGLKERRSQTLLAELTKIEDQARAYAAIFGDIFLVDVQDVLGPARADVERIYSETAQRGQMLELT